MPLLNTAITFEFFEELLRRFPFDQVINTIKLRHCSEADPENGGDGHAEDFAEAHLTLRDERILINQGNWSWTAALQHDRRDRKLKAAFVVDLSNEPSALHGSLAFQVLGAISRRFGIAPAGIEADEKSRDFLKKAASKQGISSAGSRPFPSLLRAVFDQHTEAQKSSRGPARSRVARRSIWNLIEQVRFGGDSASAAGRSNSSALSASENFPFPSNLGAGLRDSSPQATSSDPSLPDPNNIVLDGAVKQRLKPYVIQLTQGRFSYEQDDSSEAEVDTIFRKYIPEWAATRPPGEPLRLMIYAHGGLVGHDKGMQIAARQVRWWRDNGVYPLFFVWHTGLTETLWQILRGEPTSSDARGRGFDVAGLTDLLLEQWARLHGGPVIWGGMKRSAEHASDGKGGARYVAQSLKTLFDIPALSDRLEIHAVGHSAGSIFHSYFLPALDETAHQKVKTLNLMAPAITVDDFKSRLLPLIEDNKIEQTAIFTMRRAEELADNCATIYRKSLLYLIRAVLEPKRDTPILGLEESLRQDAALMNLFRPDELSSDSNAQVIFAASDAATPRFASRSSSHGGFDDDASTMESIAQRILDDDNVKPFPAPAPNERGSFEVPHETFPQRVQRYASYSMVDTAHPGTRRALCIGIDNYPFNPLGGCVNDARQWESTLSGLGFQTELLLDGQATRDAMLARIEGLVSATKAGDSLVIAYAGHGASLPDHDGDEVDGEDEAICPHDFAVGHFVIDDDLATIFRGIAEGAHVTLFTDCCHSGTITRFALGAPSSGKTGGTNVRVRFIRPTAEMVQAHLKDRQTFRPRGFRPAPRPYEDAREILFCACRATEEAAEENGHGRFTSAVAPMLAAAVNTGMNLQSFQEKILSFFDANGKQHPELHCSEEKRSELLLAGGPANFAPSGFSKQSASDLLRGVDRRKLQQAFALLSESIA